MTESFDPQAFVRRRRAQQGQAPHWRQLVRNEHPGTAKESAQMTALTLTERQEKVVAWMKTLSPGTLVTGSMADKALGKDAHKRLPEAQRKGAIEWAGTVYDGETKRNVQAYRLGQG